MASKKYPACFTAFDILYYEDRQVTDLPLTERKELLQKAVKSEDSRFAVSIRPIYYDKTYHAIPEAGGDKAFELLRKAMKDENKVAIAKTVIGTKEKLLTLIPTDDGILIETMFFADEVKQAPKEPVHPEVNEAELTMAKTLINTP